MYLHTEQRRKRVSNKMHITITTSRQGGKNRRTTTLGKGMLLTSVRVAQDKERGCKADRCHSSISQPTFSSRKPLVLYQAQERHTEKLAPRGDNVSISSCITAPRSIHTLNFPELCKIKLTSTYLPSLESCANLVQHGAERQHQGLPKGRTPRRISGLQILQSLDLKLHVITIISYELSSEQQTKPY